MLFSDFFSPDSAHTPFESYEQYTRCLFALVDHLLSRYVEHMKQVFVSESGAFKNVLYPDLEIASDLCSEHLAAFLLSPPSSQVSKPLDDLPASNDSLDIPPDSDDDNMFDALFAQFQEPDVSAPPEPDLSPLDVLDLIASRANATDLSVTPLPLFSLAQKLQLSHFSLFCFSCAILASTQTNYAAIFQVVNQNSALSAPSIEAAARVFFGDHFSITGAYGQMSLVLEQLAPVMDLKVNSAMPFSTLLSPDKRLIDFLFGLQPLRIDPSYSRFFSQLIDDNPLDPFIANKDKLDALSISFDDGTRIFSLWGDEGSGRRFTIRHFCLPRHLGCISIDCAKLFSYDFAFVQKALWAVTRECIFSDSCCCLSSLSFREEEKDKFFGYMDLAFETLSLRDITVFTVSRDKLPLKEMTHLDFTQLELPTPNNQERENLWKHYAAGYTLNPDVDLEEMATKFLFTAGKIKSALRQARSLSAMQHHLDIVRSCLFEACYAQMSHELTQKATKIKATYTWDDIVMSKDQRQALEYACDQMRYRKKVYEQWDYNRKYPYGRGLSVLLFGAPGTGKSMCAQVLANALNLELYRVDLSKVVDKYVGETEKSISMIFREAKKCNVVLFFDECDTLFAKRSDDGGSNQASNNNKTALLLQEVEAYDGVSVLATNYKHNIDPAFFRRMKFIVEFQFPDPETRYILWNTTIPKGTPLADDVDIKFLADRFEFVGGNIKNCILNAAFLAAGDPDANGEVHMKHYLQAIRYEFVKTGKVFTRADFEPYANLVL